MDNMCNTNQLSIKNDYPNLKIGDFCPGCGVKICFHVDGTKNNPEIFDQLILQNRAILSTVQATGSMISQIAPIVIHLESSNQNLWTSSQINYSTKRNESFRKNLLRDLGYSVEPGQKYLCMVSRKSGNGDQVLAAHIAPASSNITKLSFIGMDSNDVRSSRNGLLLAFGFEKAFDALQLSFIKDPNPLSNKLVVKIWDSEIRNRSIWDVSKPYGKKNYTIGSFEGRPLILGTHLPFKRALFFQALQAANKWNNLNDSKIVDYWSDNNNSPFAISYRGINNGMNNYENFLNVYRKELEENEEEENEKEEENKTVLRKRPRL